MKRLKKFFPRLVIAPQLYLFLIKLRPFGGRYFVLFACVAGLVWYAVYTNYVIRNLQDDAVAVTETYADLIKAALFDRMGAAGEKVVLEKIVGDFDIPLIITDADWNPIVWQNIGAGRLWWRRNLAEDDTSHATVKLVEARVRELKKKHASKVLYSKGSGRKIGYLVFGVNNLIRSLSWMPLLEVFLITSFMVFVYLALHNIRITERSNLWAGFAKETAHQLGTPISSLMGWVEYIKSLKETRDVSAETVLEQVERVCGDMENDLTRLKRITSRFSQVGSKPSLVPCDLNEIVRENVNYFRSRLPVLDRRIDIRTSLAKLPRALINRDLMEWVLENLFKNSVDAIKRSDGLIEMETEFVQVDRLVRIHHRDNGKGISWEDHKKIFSPGYTTKTRGWGLGLTLAKRIVEDYHNGHIYVSSSQRDKGTTFCIDLPVGSE